MHATPMTCFKHKPTTANLTRCGICTRCTKVRVCGTLQVIKGSIVQGLESVVSLELQAQHADHCATEKRSSPCVSTTPRVMASPRPSQGESGTAKAAGSIVLTDGTQMAAGSRNVARDGTRLAAMVPYSFRSKTNKVAPLASSRLPAHEHDTKALGAPSGDDGAAGIDGSSRSRAPPLRPVRGKLRAAPLGKATKTPGNSGASTPLLAKAVLERLRHLKCDPLFEDDVGQIADMETAERARKRHEIQAMLSGATATGDTEEAAAAAFGIEHCTYSVHTGSRAMATVLPDADLARCAQTICKPWNRIRAQNSLYVCTAACMKHVMQFL